MPVPTRSSDGLGEGHEVGNSAGDHCRPAQVHQLLSERTPLFRRSHLARAEYQAGRAARQLQYRH